MGTTETLRARRANVVRAWDVSRGFVLVPAGLPRPIDGTDQFHDFHAHPEHRYLAGAGSPGAVLAFDPTEGWSLFLPTPSLEERVWTGDGASPAEVAERTGVERVTSSSGLAAWLEARRGEPAALIGNADLAAHPAAYGLERWAALELDLDLDLSARLSEGVSERRRAKDAAELDCMRRAAAASLRGHHAGLRLAAPGLSERALQVEIEAEFFRAGGDRTAYGSLVGSGPNSAVLHFAPTARVMRPGELVLVDAGAECDGYASDVTRTYPAAGRFSGAQRDLYELVHAVQQAAIAGVRPGVEYRDLHMAAAMRMAEGLAALGILRGAPETLVERDAHALFFPHGLGHMLGLATHDAGGCLAGRAPSDRFGLKYLRADLPLESGYVVTVEPGVYFIRALLTDPERRRQYADAVNWERVDAMLDFGGIRIEDDVLVTADGADVLTSALPSTIGEIEALRQAGLSS